MECDHRSMCIVRFKDLCWIMEVYYKLLDKEISYLMKRPVCSVVIFRDFRCFWWLLLFGLVRLGKLFETSEAEIWSPVCWELEWGNEENYLSEERLNFSNLLGLGVHLQKPYWKDGRWKQLSQSTPQGFQTTIEEIGEPWPKLGK